MRLRMAAVLVCAQGELLSIQCIDNLLWLTSSMEPPSANKLDAEPHNGSSTIRPSRPAFQAHAGPAIRGMNSSSPPGGVGT